MPRSRRAFLQAGSASILALAGAPPILFRHPPYDLVIRGGMVFDGSGRPGRTMDLAIHQGWVAAVAKRVKGAGAEEIDARGLAVSPGFVDPHSHGDGSLTQDPRAESLIRQGVTTIVVGQDGGSRATGGDEVTPDGDEDHPTGSFTTMFNAIDQVRPSVNVASMVGLGTVRAAVVGEEDRPATPVELARMTAMVERALTEGACGASSGLEYTPGAFASRDELVALCRPLAARRLVYATHMRNEDDRVLEAIDEAIAVAQGAGSALQISHLKTQGPRNWSKLDAAFHQIEAAHRSGLDVAFDRYPYLAYQTGLTNLFPVWSRDGGIEAFLARLDDSAVAEKIRQETLAKVELIGGWNNVMVTSVRAEADRGAEGRRLGDYASEVGQDPYQLSGDLLRRSRGGVGMVGFAMSEENLERILAHPLGMVCSDGGSYAVDGPTHRGSPHPRGLGSFARVLGRYVRERHALSLPAAVRKMSALPASRYGLKDRGRLVSGAAADVAIFDPAEVADRASFEHPFQYAVGIRAVVVNGVVALRDGERVGRGSGTTLRVIERR